MEIKDKLGKAKDIKEEHKKGKHWNQHNCKEVQVEWQEEYPEKELEVEIKNRLDKMEGIKGRHKTERMHKVIRNIT